MKTKLLFVFCLTLFAASHSQTTAIPDPNFEQALIDIGIDTDGVINGQVATVNVQAVIGLDVMSRGITDLTGIEDFSSLEDLNVSGNNLTSLNTNSNTSLTVLNCGGNALNSLTIFQNFALTELNCNSNNLTALNIGNLTQLTNIECGGNSLGSVDVSPLVNLQHLVVQGNFLNTLDISQNSALTYLDCRQNALGSLIVDNGNNTSFTFFDARSNSNLYCIQVDNAAYSNANWSNKDAQTVYSPDCSTTSVPDDNFEQALIDLGYDIDGLNNSVFTFPIKSVTALDVSNKNISDLTGIEDFEDLEELVCGNNNLSALDVSQNAKLIRLYCNFNNLGVLNVSSNPDLQQLRCTDNLITALDVSNNLQLVQLRCQNNSNLTQLDLDANTILRQFRADNNNLNALSIKNNANTNITQFNILNNPNLLCVDVDNATYSTNNWPQKDAQTIYSEDCATLSLNDFKAFELAMFPNPAKDKITISIKSDAVYSLNDINGQLLRKGNLVNGNNTLDISSLGTGLYFLTIKNEAHSVVKKLVKN